MNFQVNISAGELFDLIRPATTFLSILASTLILASARKRFAFHIAIFWAGVALFLPLVIVPIYLITILLIRSEAVYPIQGRIIFPTVYLVITLAVFVVYEYQDLHSVDAHLARATFAKVNSDQITAIQQYRQALQIEENPHTHKLLALSLMEAGMNTEAISEFRLAERGDEPDDLIPLNVGYLLEKSGLKDEAVLEYKKFLTTKSCLKVDARCDSARETLRRLQ